MIARPLLPVLGIMALVLVSGCIGAQTGNLAAVEQKVPLTMMGFSGLDISTAGTEFHGKNLYLTIGNPGSDGIEIRKVTASYLDDIIINSTDSGLLPPGSSLTYVFDFNRTVDGAFWIAVDVIYDIPGTGVTKRKSGGFAIGGMDTSQMLQCSTASFEVERQKFYFGTRILSVTLKNTGRSDIPLRTTYRKDGVFQDVGEPVTLRYGQRETLEFKDLTRRVDSVVFFSDSCPGASAVIFTEDIPGV